MSAGDADKLAVLLLNRGGCGSHEPVVAEDLARRLLGSKSLRLAPPWALRDDAALVRVGSEWRIYLQEGLAAHRARFAILHELVHWAEPSASEVFCNQTAGAMLLPLPTFLGAVKSRRMVSVARSFGADETCAWLRFGEATGAPLAVVTPQSVRVRGRSYSWPVEPVLRELAERHHVPGLRKARLQDDRSRTVLRAG